MLALSKHTRDADLKIAADYFSKLTYHKWERVVEAATVPGKTGARRHQHARPHTGWRLTEKIGTRIIEGPEDAARTDLRDPHSGFIAYVPPGSIARGKQLVESGAGRLPCAACHGADFKGSDGTPALAGRSPSYIIRQFYDIQHGNRSGPLVEPMKAEIAGTHRLPDLMVAIAASIRSSRTALKFTLSSRQ